MSHLNLLLVSICSIIAQCQAIPDELSERLFEASTPNIFEDITVNLQGRTNQYLTDDNAPKPLFTHVNNTVLSKVPTIVRIRELFKKYDRTQFLIDRTPNDFVKENNFLNKIIDTPVMQIAMNFLHKEGIIQSMDAKDQRQLLKTIWFKNFPRERNVMFASCGFKHVFMKEIVKKNEITGLHNWIYYYDQERDSQNELDYKGYFKSISLGNKAQILKYRVRYKDVPKPVNTMFIGTLPEFEMALYTVCHQLKKLFCDVSLAGQKFRITILRHYKEQTIISAFPDF
ncbi:poly(U)-specific endoribonuclease homolog [Contarinia nasturtii]|uniref:poly(U)-specific endoribonuclease homolog n=1 Tax=Contarinia nasturtii TaxID=265458 RepID=UPI0012D45564|nr:poly(U)-specific endoribonuclease homolog [Contarinia nasturtii]